MFSSDDYLNINEAWYSGQSGYRTTASGRRVMRDEPDEAEQLRQSDAIAKNPKVQAERQAAAKARLAAKGNLPIRKPKQNEEFESYVENLQNEGYDLSKWTWEGIEEFYEEKKEFPKAKVERQIDRHLSNASSSWSSRGGRSNPRKTDSYKARYRKMSAIQGSVERGEDPRKDTVQGDQRKIFTKEYGTPVSAKTVDNEKSAYTPGGLRAHQTKAGGYRKLTRKEEFEAIVEHLFVEGYSDSIEAAELMAENIGEEWVEMILEKDETEIGITGLPIPVKNMSPAKRHEFEKKRRENLKKQPGTSGDSKLIQALRNKAKETGNYAEAKADPEDAVQRLRTRNMRLQQDHPEVPSGRPQTEFRRRRHEESRGKKTKE